MAKDAMDKRQQRHLAAVHAILARDDVRFTPDNVVNLLAYLQAAKNF